MSVNPDPPLEVIVLHTLLSGVPSSVVAWMDPNYSFCGGSERSLQFTVACPVFTRSRSEKNGSAVNTDSKRASNRLRGHPPAQEKHGNDAACEFNL